ncbi:hypothetical protein GCM10009641_20300 [Mycobacterium cookii]|uniref:DUF732 domain-containing protein n=1 Tax=Mycobacterium cookii TaxID=1775 RepID=A0A7I7KUH5_9MYCO|nr:DUF732 domain-containing protein [Mycobacterium cookii]MCV7328753.1 DUF732 domain-containing protein [Mycobacterium cookii]BBX45379.1 hypothetical protein MCOO_13940 [Mycobacterium cookii]
MRLLLASASFAVMVGVAAPAMADPPPPSVPDNPAADTTFLDSLKTAGMTYTSQSSVIAAGKMACDMMNAGTSEKDVVDKLSMLNPGLNSGGAMKFAALASSAYCPDYLNKSSAPTKSNSPFGGFGGMGR